MPQHSKAMAMSTLLLERSDDTLNHAVLLRAMWRDELLSKPVAANQRCIAAAGEHQAAIGSKQEGRGDSPPSSCGLPNFTDNGYTLKLHTVWFYIPPDMIKESHRACSLAGDGHAHAFQFASDLMTATDCGCIPILNCCPFLAPISQESSVTPRPVFAT